MITAVPLFLKDSLFIRHALTTFAHKTEQNGYAKAM
jgi:hypothetical protein